MHTFYEQYTCLGGTMPLAWLALYNNYYHESSYDGENSIRSTIPHLATPHPRNATRIKTSFWLSKLIDHFCVTTMATLFALSLLLFLGWSPAEGGFY